MQYLLRRGSRARGDYLWTLILLALYLRVDKQQQIPSDLSSLQEWDHSREIGQHLYGWATGGGNESGQVDRVHS